MTRGKKLTLADLRELAQARGGSCLAEACLGAARKHLWRCAEGHEWEATPACLRQGRWCPACSRLRRRVPLAALQDLARAKGGELLSETYVGALHHLSWRCQKGHAWEATANRVQGGTWCPLCRGRKPRRFRVLALAARQGEA